MAGWSFLDEMKLNGMDWLKKISQNQSQTHTHIQLYHYLRIKSSLNTTNVKAFAKPGLSNAKSDWEKRKEKEILFDLFYDVIQNEGKIPFAVIIKNGFCCALYRMNEILNI